MEASSSRLSLHNASAYALREIERRQEGVGEDGGRGTALSVQAACRLDLSYECAVSNLRAGEYDSLNDHLVKASQQAGVITNVLTE